MTTYPDAPGYQKNSDTSAAAAMIAQAGSEKQRQIILAAMLMRQANPAMQQGITIDEAAQVLSGALGRDVPPGTASARVRELEMKDKIHKTDTRRKTRTGCTATVYALGLKGRGEAGRIEAREHGVGRARRTGTPTTRPASTQGGLEEAVKQVISGDYRTTAKNDKCSHQKYGFEDCENCITDFLQAALDKAGKPMVYGMHRITPEQMAQNAARYIGMHHPLAQVTEVKISAGQDVLEALGEQMPKYEYLGVDLASGPDSTAITPCPPGAFKEVDWQPDAALRINAQTITPADVVGIPVTQSALDKLRRAEAIGGHGWVFPRLDGAKVCAGPSSCRKCKDQQKYKEAMEQKE